MIRNALAMLAGAAAGALVALVVQHATTLDRFAVALVVSCAVAVALLLRRP